MSEWEDMCEMFGQRLDDENALDNILDSIHGSNMAGIVESVENGSMTMEEAEQAAMEMGYENYLGTSKTEVSQ